MVGVLIRMRLRLLRHTLVGGARGVMVLIGGLLGLIFALFTAWLVAVGALESGSLAVDIDVAAIAFGMWTLGWVVGPVVVGASDETLQPEQFRLLPLRPRRLAGGLLVAAVFGVPPLVSLVAFAGLVVRGAGLGAAPTVIALVGVVGQLALVITISRVVVGALGAVLRSRRGRDLGVLLATCAALLVLPLQYLLPALGSAATSGPGAVVAVAARVLPSGWAPVAVQAAAQGRWVMVAATLGGLLGLVAVLGLAWSVLLERRMTAPPTGSTPLRAAGIGNGWLDRLIPATATGGVVAKELRTWWRDPRRRSTLLVSMAVGIALPLPSSFGEGPGMVAYVALWLVWFCVINTANLYGLDGTALWHTLVTPRAPRADVRGRQWGWLLTVGPVAVLAAVAVPAVADPGAYPWVLGLTPAVLGAGAGVVVLQSVIAAFPLPEQRANPFALGGSPGLSTALRGLAVGLLLAAATLPVLAVLIAGALLELPAVTWLGVPLGAAVGVGTAWWWGAIAHRRLDERGPELLATVRPVR